MKRTVLALYFTVFTLTLNQAHAYLDPASGSMFLQVILGAVAGAVVVLKAYWFQISNFFRMLFSKKSKQV